MEIKANDTFWQRRKLRLMKDYHYTDDEPQGSSHPI